MELGIWSWEYGAGKYCGAGGRGSDLFSMSGSLEAFLKPMGAYGEEICLFELALHKLHTLFTVT